MVRRLLFAQDKGGVGKSVLVRAAAELDPDALIVEIEASPRLIELGERVRHCPVRVTREEILRNGANAARAEFDRVIAHLLDLDTPRVLVDAGANVGESLFDTLPEFEDYLRDEGIEIAVVVPVTAEPGALAGAATLLAKAPRFAVTSFVVVNGMRGPVDLQFLQGLEAAQPTYSDFALQQLEVEAQRLLVDGGLAPIRGLETKEARRRLMQIFGPALGCRIRGDLLRFRFEAMAAVHDAVNWLGAA